MADFNPDPEQTPVSQASVRIQSNQPPGVLPRNAQTWVIAGLATVMVATIALSGNSAKTKSTAPPRWASIIDPNAQRIAEYRNRLDEETRKLAVEQATLNQAKQAATTADPRVAATMQSETAPERPLGQQPTPPDAQASAKRQLEAERERKEYNSLFASNLALTYRKDSPAGDSAAPGAETLPRTAVAPYPYFYPVPPTAASSYRAATQGDAPVASTAPARTPLAEVQAQIPESHTRLKLDQEMTLAEGKQYRLLEGTILETVLTNRLNGALAGPANTMLSTDVYSHDREHLLIPQGARILGEVKPVTNVGQERLAVVFHRIIMPDGFSVSLDQFHGLNQIGETGLRDQVNHHYLEMFGISIAIGAIAGLSQANTTLGITESAADAYRQGFAASLSQSSLRILDRFLNILPTVTIHEGHRIKIYLASDLLLPAYDKHRVPSNF